MDKKTLYKLLLDSSLFICSDDFFKSKEKYDGVLNLIIHIYDGLNDNYEVETYISYYTNEYYDIGFNKPLQFFNIQDLDEIEGWVNYSRWNSYLRNMIIEDILEDE